jgi:hypothetical protein
MNCRDADNLIRIKEGDPDWKLYCAVDVPYCPDEKLRERVDASAALQTDMLYSGTLWKLKAARPNCTIWNRVSDWVAPAVTQYNPEGRYGGMRTRLTFHFGGDHYRAGIYAARVSWIDDETGLAAPIGKPRLIGKARVEAGPPVRAESIRDMNRYIHELLTAERYKYAMEIV